MNIMKNKKIGNWLLKVVLVLTVLVAAASFSPRKSVKVFDVHLHGSKDRELQLSKLKNAGVYKAAISSSWELQETYRGNDKTKLLFGLMFPCPNGKVPYSLQPCFTNGNHWPDPAWVEEQIKTNRIDYLGEVLSQYYGISPSDSSLYPYYRLAEKYAIPVGIHTGAAGPGHGSPDFKMEMGHPSLLRKILTDFPRLKIWIMHAGDQHYKETMQLMRENERVYADISVISNPDIVPPKIFAAGMKEFIDAGLEDRLMFGSDNGDIVKTIRSVEELSFLSKKQKRKIFYLNAEKFFRKSN